MKNECGHGGGTNYSLFGERFKQKSGILQLMDDLGTALAGDGSLYMLGGGNPARIPQIEQRFRRCMVELLENGDAFERTIGDYDGPRGDPRFIEAVAGLLREHLGWDVGAGHIAITNGSQSSFFALANLFGGPGPGGRNRKIVLPLAPEYIGYADIGLNPNLFEARRPHIEILDDGLFKYHVDLETLRIDDEVGAVCVSRPTNPTGNVLSDDEMRRLADATARAGVPFIIDCAYGLPFPGIVFTEAQPFWNGDNTIVCLSLSKLGLPGVRTGIVVARPDVIGRIEAITATLNLATGSFGQSLTLGMMQSGEILELCRDLVRPFYQDRAQQALAALRDGLGDLPVLAHKAEGGFFLWLWFRDLPVTGIELYERLKTRGVLVVPGEHFFFGINGEWRHRHECIRLGYTRDMETVLKGIGILVEETRALYGKG